MKEGTANEMGVLTQLNIGMEFNTRLYEKKRPVLTVGRNWSLFEILCSPKRIMTLIQR